MTDSSGFGACDESGLATPCLLDGRLVNESAMMFLNLEPPITAGREVCGFPKRQGEPSLRLEKDTSTGTLSHAGQRMAMGTMVYKHDTACADPEACAAKPDKITVDLKLIPWVTGKPHIAESSPSR